MEVPQKREALGPHISAQKTAYRTLVFNWHMNEKETYWGFSHWNLGAHFFVCILKLEVPRNSFCYLYFQRRTFQRFHLIDKTFPFYFLQVWSVGISESRKDPTELDCGSKEHNRLMEKYTSSNHKSCALVTTLWFLGTISEIELSSLPGSLSDSSWISEHVSLPPPKSKR